MEKGPSEYAEYWTSEFSEVLHYKHANEFGFKKITEYSKAAKAFANSKDSSNLAFKRNDGSICKYNPNTKEFIATSKSGRIITYFRTSFKYFIKEFLKNGIEKLQGDW